jgi:hypothetical protein
MNEKPILFSAPMVRAILEGRKTQTRRAMNPQPSDEFHPHVGRYHRTMIDGRSGEAYPSEEQYFGVSDEREDYVCKFGEPSDRLWVKETFRAEELDIDSFAGTAGTDGIRFAADGKFQAIENTEAAAEKWCAAYANGKWQDHWRPSIFMPRWASRITLEIVSVRVERLQDISIEDAIAEGYPADAEANGVSPMEWYCAVWSAINGLESWEKNPWVWVIEFKKI